MAGFPKKRIEEYFELEEKRLKAKREADSFTKQQKEIEAEVEEYAKPLKAPVNKYGFTVYFQEKKKAVPWKEEFIKIEGDKAAEALIEAQPTTKSIVIERIAK